MTRTYTGTVARLVVVAWLCAGCGGGESAGPGASTATTLTLYAGDGQAAIAGTPLTARPAVIATDATGKPVRDVAVRFEVIGEGSATGLSQTTSTDGVARVGRWILGPTPGVDTLVAVVEGLEGSPVTFTARSVAGFAAQIVTGAYHTCVLTDIGMAYCFGSDGHGEIGDGAVWEGRSTPTAVIGGITFTELAASWGSTCGLDTAGHAWCWGLNVLGDLGDSTQIDRWIPTRVVGGHAFRHIVAAEYHFCGLTDTGSAYCWGPNSAGQLGDSTNTLRPYPVPVAGGLTFAKLTGGGGHTCGLTAAGLAWCWGVNQSGELGDGTMTYRNAPVPVTGGLTFTDLAAGGGQGFTCGVASTGQAYCWGEFGGCCAPAPVAGNVTFTAFVGGHMHACGLDGNGAAYCWGNGYEGQLGNGTTTGQASPTPVAGGVVFARLAAGSEHTCGITATGQAYCWGRNIYGQLGDVTTTGRTTPVRVRYF